MNYIPENKNCSKHLTGWKIKMRTKRKKMKAKKNVSKGLYSVLSFWAVMFVFNSILQLVRTKTATIPLLWCRWLVCCFLWTFSSIVLSIWWTVLLAKTICVLHQVPMTIGLVQLGFDCGRLWHFCWGTFVAKLSYTANVYGH